jgi:hypothetical protein
MGFHQIPMQILVSAVDPSNSDAVVEQGFERLDLDAWGPGLLQEMASPMPQLTLEQGRDNQRIGFSRLIDCVVVHLRCCTTKKIIQRVGRAEFQPRRFSKGVQAWSHGPLIEAMEVSLEDTRELVLERLHIQNSS